MRRFSFMMVAFTLSLAASTVFAAPRPAEWPSIDKQLRQARVEPGSALEALILDNQDFKMLRAAETNDKIPVPLWLRVYWRKGHPESHYSAADPTGGYPLVLKEVYEWMVSHPSLVPGDPDKERTPGEDGDEVAAPVKTAIVAGERRISGLQTSPRSESDIRVNHW